MEFHFERAPLRSALQFLIPLFALFCNSSHAISWRWTYKVLVSPHFEILYREDQKDLAKHYIIAAERAHELLLPIFKEGPSSTTILLQDDTDLANGEATFIPYPHIIAFPVLPGTMDSIDDYGDWALELMVHEYTHILNMYSAHGFYAALKPIFGSIVRPNAVLPTWYMEGLAVYTESAFTDHGRLRATETQASARALVLSDLIHKEDIARVNENQIPSWPYGSRPYLYGAWWWETLHREKGLAAIEPLNQDYSRRLPFLINGPLLSATGHNASEILDATKERLEGEAKKQISEIQASGAHSSTPIANEGGEQMVFAINPAGNRMVYWRRSVSSSPQGAGPGRTGAQVKLKERTSQGQNFSDIESKLLFKSTSSVQVRWLDNDRFVYDQVDMTSPYTQYRDLYLYDFAKDETKRLTYEARAQEASPSPSGDKLVFIQNDGGRNHLCLLDLASGEVHHLLKGGFNNRLSSPEFLNENEILYVLRVRSGQEKIHVYNLLTKQFHVWNDQLKNSQALRKISNGFLITDAQTNVRNVYWLHDDKTTPVSNTLTNIEAADYDPQRTELVVSELTGNGYRLNSLPFTTFHPPTLPPAQWEPPPKPTTDKVKVTEENYQPLSYLLPRFWIPMFYPVENGLLIQGQTWNYDPVGRNRYNLLGAYDTVTRRGSYGANFTNSSLPTNITLAYSKMETYLGASGAVFDSQMASVSFAQYWPFQNRNLQWSVGGLWLDTLGLYHQIGPTVVWQYSHMDNPFNRWLGYHIEFSHTEYLPKENYVSYGRSYLHLASQIGLGGGHRIEFQTRAALAPRLPFRDTVILGDRSLGGNYLVNLANSNFLLRGYPSGEFVGRKLLNANLEYVFPPFRLDKGYGTFPLFLQDLELALYADAIAVDGAAYDVPLQSYVVQDLQHFHMGTGGEFRLNTNAFYHLPLSLILGLYYGLSQRYGGGFTPFIGIGMGDLASLGL